MTLPRKNLSTLKTHFISEVFFQSMRRSYLYDIDAHSGKNYENRRQWIKNRVRILLSLFAIEIFSYSVKSNPIHLVVKIMPQRLRAGWIMRCSNNGPIYLLAGLSHNNGAQTHWIARLAMKLSIDWLSNTAPVWENWVGLWKVKWTHCSSRE